MTRSKKAWYDYLWLWPILYFTLGFFNILFAWLGMIDFMLPLLLASFYGNKNFCNKYCGRGQLLRKIGKDWKVSRYAPTPRFLCGKGFRFAFLIFFMSMLCTMLYNTYLVAAGVKTLKAAVTLLWTINIPWNWAFASGLVEPWVASFSFGLYSVMLTSTIIGIIVMYLYMPRSWCSFCPMGTMTQSICKIKS